MKFMFMSLKLGVNGTVQISLCINIYMSAKLVHGNDGLPHCLSKNTKPTFHQICKNYQVKEDLKIVL